jgi:hypothetical protein
MRFLKTLLIALFSTASFVVGHDDHGDHDHDHQHDGDVVPLTASSFKTEIEAHPLTLVEFFAPCNYSFLYHHMLMLYNLTFFSLF